MQKKWAYVSWALGLWLLLIFGTSCTVIFLDDFIRFLQRATDDPKAQKQIADFWIHYGFFFVKGWHATEYAVLTVLCTAALRRWRNDWSTNKTIAVSFAIAVLYAASDEWHQTFVPGRDGCVRDVLIDSGGALLAVFWLFARARRTPVTNP